MRLDKSYGPNLSKLIDSDEPVLKRGTTVKKVQGDKTLATPNYSGISFLIEDAKAEATPAPAR